MGDERPKVEDLVVANSDHLVFRLVRPNDFVATHPVGQRVLPSALPSSEYDPKPKSYGASVFVKELLQGGLTDVHNACDKWRSYRLSEVPIAKIVNVGVAVRLSPQDCSFLSIRHAHASLIGVTRMNRTQLLRLVEQYLLGG